jgi:hypothetical protein
MGGPGGTGCIAGYLERYKWGEEGEKETTKLQQY